MAGPGIGGVGAGSGSIDPHVDTDPCQAPACVDAKSKLDAARSRFTSTCNGLRGLLTVEKFLQTVVAVPIWVVVLIAVVATILWFLGLGFLAILLWALVVIYVIVWIVLFVLVRIENFLVVSLAEQGDAVAQAVKDVVANCPEQCRGDLSVPICQPN
jgi:hypothetical protein